MSAPLDRLWTDKCDVLVRRSSVDESTGRTVFEEVKLYGDLPCRVSFKLSFETVSAVKDAGGMASALGQSVKLFLDPEVEIPPGSKIVVYRDGREMAFCGSGLPAVFDSHQEVRLERLDRWA